LLEEKETKQQKIIALGSRIFIKAVEEKTPTPKNVKRREARMVLNRCLGLELKNFSPFLKED